MSGLCGIVQFDGAPVERETLRKMAEAAGHLAPDGIRYLVEGNAGLAYLAMHTTPEAERENQPLQSENGELWMVADARVDNRQELIDLLGTKGYLRGKAPTDADLLLAAYLCWGEECPKHILGDFSFVVLDQANQRLFCARDPMGIRPLFYSQVGERLLVASGLVSLRAALPEARINLDFLQDLMAGQYERWIFDSAYEGMKRVPPAHTLTAKRGNISLNNYWVFGGQAEIRYKKEEKYAEAFYEIFERAVKDRLRSQSPVGILTSGGLDSSSVACVTDRLISNGAINVEGWMLSCVFDETPGADEHEFLDSVAARCKQLKSRRLLCDDLWAGKGLLTGNTFVLDEPEVDLLPDLMDAPMREAEKIGCRVMLSGFGGDLVFGGDPYFYGLLLRDVPFRRLPKELPFFGKYSGWPNWLLLLYALTAPFVPERARKAVQKPMQRVRRDPFNRFVSSELSQPSELEKRQWFKVKRFRHRVTQLTFNEFTNPFNVADQATLDQQARQAGLELRFPFYDLRLIEFLLALPPEFYFRDGLNRYILREAMIGVLPPELVVRTSKAHFGELIEKGMRDKGKGIITSWLEDSISASLNLVDSRKLQTAWKDYWDDKGHARARPLERFLCVESWLRRAQGGSP